MNTEETIRILALLETNYQQFKNRQAAIELWSMSFADTPFEVVFAAVMQIVQTDPDEFCPKVAKVRRTVSEILYGKRLSEQEAWNFIRDALDIGDCIYHPREEWLKLPEEIRALTSPSQLKQWANMDADQVESVIASNFMRSWRQVEERQYRDRAMPAKLKEAVKAIGEKSGLYRELPSPVDYSHKKLTALEAPKREVELSDKLKEMLEGLINA